MEQIKSNQTVTVDEFKQKICGARTRHGGQCKNLPMRNGRCRMHGGGSTGPKTKAGIARQRAAVTIHGGRGREMHQLRTLVRALNARTKELLET